MEQIAELLKPRYKVVADYPSREKDNWGIGDVIDPYKQKFAYPKEIIAYCDKYPNLFRPLQWWQSREESEMPEYVKSRFHCCVMDVHFDKDQICKITDVPKSWDSFNFFEPATREQYEQYIKQ